MSGIGAEVVVWKKAKKELARRETASVMEGSMESEMDGREDKMACISVSVASSLSFNQGSGPRRFGGL